MQENDDEVVRQPQGREGDGRLRCDSTRIRMRAFAAITPLDPDAPTAALLALSRQPREAIDVEAVRRCVDAGADVCFHHPDVYLDRPILHTFIARGLVQCVQACLLSPQGIDFTLSGKKGGQYKRNALHCLCSLASPVRAAAILSLLVERLRRTTTVTIDYPRGDHLKEEDREETATAPIKRTPFPFPQQRFLSSFSATLREADTIDWMAKEEEHGLDFLSLAAYYHKLSVFWPIVRSLPYFRARLTRRPDDTSLHGPRIEIATELFPTDWVGLGPTEQARVAVFYRKKEMLQPTTALARLSAWGAHAHPEDGSSIMGHHLHLIQHYVEGAGEGDFADVQYHKAGMNRPTLNEFIFRGELEAVRRCFKTPHPIDFNAKTGRGGRNILHVVARLSPPARAAAMMEAVLDRLDSPVGKTFDYVDWRTVDGDGNDVLSNAAECGTLSALWPTLYQRVKYYKDTADAFRAIYATAEEKEKQMRRKRRQEARRQYYLQSADSEEENPGWSHSLSPSPQLSMTSRGADLVRQQQQHHLHHLSSITTALPPPPFTLTAGIEETDWNRLGADQQIFFGFFDGLLALRRPLQFLERHQRDLVPRLVLLDPAKAPKTGPARAAAASTSSPSAPEASLAALVEECVAKGDEDFGAYQTFWRRPILHHLIRYGMVEAVARCLRLTQRPIDFTVQGEEGNTALHWICRIEEPPRAVAILFLVMERLHSHERDDAVDWGKPDAQGHDFLSCAAAVGYLSAFWPLLRAGVRYFRDVHVSNCHAPSLYCGGGHGKTMTFSSSSRGGNGIAPPEQTWRWQLTCAPVWEDWSRLQKGWGPQLMQYIETANRQFPFLWRCPNQAAGGHADPDATGGDAVPYAVAFPLLARWFDKAKVCSCRAAVIVPAAAGGGDEFLRSPTSSSCMSSTTIDLLGTLDVLHTHTGSSFTPEEEGVVDRAVPYESNKEKIREEEAKAGRDDDDDHNKNDKNKRGSTEEEEEDGQLFFTLNALRSIRDAAQGRGGRHPNGREGTGGALGDDEDAPLLNWGTMTLSRLCDHHYPNPMLRNSMELYSQYTLHTQTATHFHHYPLDSDMILQCVQGHERRRGFGEGLADVLYRRSGMTAPLLHQLVARGAVEAVLSCLQTPNMLDFTVTDDDGRTPLHLLCCTAMQSAVCMLSGIARRLAQHPGDVVDWAQRDHQGKDFLSFVVERRLLGVLWPVARDIPHFAMAVDPIVLRVMPAAWDWELLAEDEQMRFTIDLPPPPPSSVSVLEEPSAPSPYPVCHGRHHPFPHNEPYDNPHEIDLYVNNMNSVERRARLHREDVRCRDERATALGRPFPIVPQRTAALGKWLSPYLECDVRRDTQRIAPPRLPAVEPEDLHETVGRMVREEGADVMYQTWTMARPILHEFVYRGYVQCVKACLETPHSIDFTQRGWLGRTVLHAICDHVLYHRQEEALMRRKHQQAQRRVGQSAATTTTEEQAVEGAVIHYSADAPTFGLLSVYNEKARGVSVEVLQAVVRRLGAHSLRDRVDWMQKDDHGYDFLSYAALHGMLSLVWPQVKYVPDFARKSSPIPIYAEVLEEDWVALGDDGQSHFLLKKGVLFRSSSQTNINSSNNRNNGIKNEGKEEGEQVEEGPRRHSAYAGGMSAATDTAVVVNTHDSATQEELKSERKFDLPRKSFYFFGREKI